MNLADTRRMARELLNKHGLDHWHLDFDRSVSRRGKCDYANHTISLSEKLTLLASEAEVKNTLLHEIAHALTPGQKHNSVWRQKFISIGGNGQRCSTRENEVERPIEIHCRNHGLTSKRHKKIDLKRGYYCKKCGPGTYTLFMKDTRTGRYTYA